jgi:hypothetical protein
LDAELEESWIVRAEEYKAAKVLDISESYIFGIKTMIKTIGFYHLTNDDTVITENSILQYWEKLAYGFGLVSREDGATQPVLLRGCRINGVTYGTVDVEEEPETIPSEFVLYQNYPNPFNPSTTISFSLPEAGNVQIKIYDVLGREITKFIDEEKSAGKYSVIWNGRNYASGVYFYSVTFNNQSLYKKMLLIK